MLEATFSQIGEVRSVELGGESWAWVAFEDPEDAAEAVKRFDAVEFG